MLDTLSLLLLAPLPFALAMAAFNDAQRFSIPNWTSAVCALGAIPALLLSGPTLGAGLETLALHLATGAGAFLIGFGLFAFGLWGGGDGKLLAATALWFEPDAALALIFWIAMAGGVLGLAAVAARWFETAVAPRYGVHIPALGRWATHAPYGVAIAAGALIAFPHTSLFQTYF